MPAKGNIAKEQVTKIITEAFGNNFVAVVDKKIYVWTEEGGEKVQVAISLTCPKSPVAVDENSTLPTSEAKSTTPVSTQINLSPEDQEKIKELKYRLGIF